MRYGFPECHTDTPEHSCYPQEWIFAEKVQRNVAIAGILVFKEEQAPKRNADHDRKIGNKLKDGTANSLFPFAIQDNPKQNDPQKFHEVKIFHRQQVDNRKCQRAKGQQEAPVRLANCENREIEGEQKTVEDN